MNLNELYQKLKSLGIADENIFLHGLFASTNDNDKLALTIYRGQYSIIYEIYYKERGQKSSIIKFTNENDACEYYLKRQLNL